jgi:hypothetical protein
MYVIDAATASSFEDSKSALGKIVLISVNYFFLEYAGELCIIVLIEDISVNYKLLVYCYC